MSEVDRMGNIERCPPKVTLWTRDKDPDARLWTDVWVGDPATAVEYVRADLHAGAVDALDFTRRTLDDPDLDEAEALMRIGGVVRRTLDQLGGQ